MSNEKITNGILTLIYTNRISLANYDTLLIPIEIKKNDQLIFAFDISYDGGDREASYRGETDSNPPIVRFTLKNFGSPFGTYTQKPIRIGEADGQGIQVMFSIVKPEDGMPILDLSVYLEPKHG